MFCLVVFVVACQGGPPSPAADPTTPPDPPVEPTARYEYSTHPAPLATTFPRTGGLTDREYRFPSDASPEFAASLPVKTRSVFHLHHLLERAGVVMNCSEGECTPDLTRCPGGTPTPAWARALHKRAMQESQDFAVLTCPSRVDPVLWGPVDGLTFATLSEQLTPLGAEVSNVDGTALVVIP